MNRKELYAAVKQLGLAEALKSKYGSNYTLLSNDTLLKEVDAALKKEDLKKEEKKTKKAQPVKKETPAKPKKVTKPQVQEECPIETTLIELVSSLVKYKVLAPADADKILSHLK